MPQVFNTQTLLQLRLSTGTDLTSAVNLKILWQDPNGSRGEWTDVTVDASSVLVYNFTDTDITVEGKWRFQAYAELGGLVGFGQIVEQRFYAPLINEES